MCVLLLQARADPSWLQVPAPADLGVTSTALVLVFDMCGGWRREPCVCMPESDIAVGRITFKGMFLLGREAEAGMAATGCLCEHFLLPLGPWVAIPWGVEIPLRIYHRPAHSVQTEAESCPGRAL